MLHITKQQITGFTVFLFNFKQMQLEQLTKEVEKWQHECMSVEAMRRNALDSLHYLEKEVTQLQDADVQLKQLKDEYNILRGQVTQD